MSSTRINHLTAEGRRLCQFTTPDILAEAMARWAITSMEDSVLDPCCGNSNLLEKAMDRLITLGATPRKASRKVYGIEVSSRTAKIATAVLLNKYGPSVPNVLTADFLRTETGRIPSFKAIVCNPPYKRHQGLGMRYKLEIADRVHEETGVWVPGTSNQYVHFLLHALTFLEPGGRMVFLLPSQCLTNGFGRTTRDFVASQQTVHHVVLLDERLTVFPNSMSTACLIFIEKSPPRPDWTTRFVKLDSVEAIIDYFGDWEKNQKAAATVRTVSQQALVGAEKWVAFFARVTSRPVRNTLSNIATIRRGIATGANDFFFLTESGVRGEGLRPKYLRPVLIHAHDAPYPDFTKWDWKRLKQTGKRVWMLDCRVAKEDLDSSLLHYIQGGEEKNYHKRYLTSRRNPWYHTEERKPAKVLFTYMSNGRPRFIYNRGKLLTSNAFHSIYPHRKIASDTTRLKALLAFLNSSHTSSRLALIGRTYSGGLLKLEPSEAGAIPILDLDSLPRNAIQNLAKAFDGLCHQCRQSGSWNTSEIDRLVRTLIR